MKYEARTPEEYFSVIGKENDWKSGQLERLCALIKLKAPEIIEDVLATFFATALTEGCSAKSMRKSTTLVSM